MRNVVIKLLTVFALIISPSCVSLQSVSLTQIPKQRSKVVKASAEKMMFMLIAFDNDYVDSVTDQLKAKCPNGKVTGILTKDYFTNYFLFFIAKRTVTATGYCVRGA